MRSLILTVAVALGALGFTAVTPSEAQAQRWGRGGYGGYYAPGYSYYSPGYSSYYSAPSYGSYYYTPGYSSYNYSAPTYYWP